MVCATHIHADAMTDVEYFKAALQLRLERHFDYQKACCVFFLVVKMGNQLINGPMLLNVWFDRMFANQPDG